MSLANEIFKKERQEFLNEGCIATNKNKSLSVGVTLDSGRNYGDSIAYFKCARKTNFGGIIARISFIEPKYITHYKDSEQMILTKNEKKQLMKLLQIKGKQYDTVWKDLISAFNDAILLDNKDNAKFVLPLTLDIPDYTKL